jgi:uncharacterized membrane-anchored protein YjiN (DUF445 family)
MFNLIPAIPALLPKIRLYLIVAVVAAGAVGIFAAWWYVGSLNKKLLALESANSALIVDNKILHQNTEVLAENLKKMAEANSTNEQTIKKLIKERSQAQAAIDRLAAESTADRKVISNLNKKLDDLLKDPKNDGIVSPALRETIRDIQAIRKQR